MFLRLVAGREHDQIRGHCYAVLHAHAARDEAIDIGELPELDRAAGNEIGTADVEIITAAAGQIFELPASAVIAEIELEPDALQTVKQRLIQFFRLLGQHDVAAPRQGQRHRGCDQIVILERALVVDGVGELRRRLDIGDERRRALHQRHVSAARMQILCDVVAAIAGADDEGPFALPALAVVIPAGMKHCPGKIRQARNLRHIRDAGNPGRHHHMARMHRPRGAVGSPQRHLPATFGRVIDTALEFGAGPEVELHGVDIGFEPVGELVFRDIDRPVRRERHIGQVIDLHLIMQRQRVVALAPVVADTGFAIDDQRIDPELLQSCGDRKACLAATDHQHIGLAVGIFHGFPALIEPVRSFEIARIGLAARPRIALLLLEALEFIEHCEQRPSLQCVAVGLIRNQPQDSAAAPDRRFELKDRLDRTGSRAGDAARCGAIGIDAEAGGRGARGVDAQFVEDGFAAIDSLQVPAQRQHIAPETVGMKQRFQRAVAWRYKCIFESHEPILGCDRDVLRLVEHARPRKWPSSRRFL